MEAIVNNLIKAIGWSILHSLWQGALIYGVLFIALMAWPKMNARLKHNLAFGSLFLIFASFCFTFCSVFEMPSVNNVAIKNISISQFTYQDLTKLSSNLKAEAYFPVLAIVYSVGIAFQLIVLISGYFKLKRLKQASTLAVPKEWNEIFELILAQLKLNKTVKFHLSSKVNVPLVIGFFKPVVLFPVALATQLDLKQVEAILIHELSHIRRNDYLVNLVKTCVETLLFFNPFVWLTTKFIHIEREHACDDLVVNFTGTPLTYAHALLKLELLKDKQTPAFSLAATGTNQHLYQRIKRITDMKTNYMNAKQQFFILTLTIATVLSLAWINPSKKPIIPAKRAHSLLTIKTSPIEVKSLKAHLFTKADTDTTKAKRKYKVVVTDEKGNVKSYQSLNEMPDSLRREVLIQEAKKDSLFAYFKSPEWSTKMADIQKNSAEMVKKFQSKEWKDQMAKVQEQSVAMAKKFTSPEWKAQVEAMHKNAEVYQKKVNSPEWKAQIDAIQKNAEEMTKKFNSKEWKDQMAKVQENSAAMVRKFQSPEWKAQIEAMQKNAEEMSKKYNSKEWKDKIEEYKKLQESPEYKQLREKYEKDLEELKKKKGIKTDKAFLLFDTNESVGKLFLPATEGFKALFSALPSVKFEGSTLKFDALPSFKLDNSFKQFDALPATLYELQPSKN